jgi:hypothetical protein
MPTVPEPEVESSVKDIAELVLLAGAIAGGTYLLYSILRRQSTIRTEIEELEAGLAPHMQYQTHALEGLAGEAPVQNGDEPAGAEDEPAEDGEAGLGEPVDATGGQE